MKLKMKLLLLVALALFTDLCSSQSMKETDTQSASGYKPRSGMVPNENTAIRIAIAVLTPIYGVDAIRNQQPFVATLTGDTWTVVGTLPKERVGGVAEIRIAKVDGRILYVMHGQ
jgi:NTF2 fold immunity protein